MQQLKVPTSDGMFAVMTAASGAPDPATCVSQARQLRVEELVAKVLSTGLLEVRRRRTVGMLLWGALSNVSCVYYSGLRELGSGVLRNNADAGSLTDPADVGWHEESWPRDYMVPRLSFWLVTTRV